MASVKNKYILQNSEDMIEVLGENGEGVRNEETALLGFIENTLVTDTNSPTCSSYGFVVLHS